MFDRCLSFLVAASLATLLWLYTRSRESEMLDNVPVPVLVTVAGSQADRFDLEITGPAQVPVSFRGPPSGIRELREMLEQGELQVNLTVSVPEDRRNESYCQEILRVDASDVHAPFQVTPIVLEGRNRIPVTLRRLVERRLPVRLHPSPDPDAGISKITFEPATVVVRGPKIILDRVRSLPTQSYVAPTSSELGSETDVVACAVPLVRELEGRPIFCTPDSVTAHLTYTAREKLYELKDVPISFLCPPNFPLHAVFSGHRSNTVSLQVWGPAQEHPPKAVVFVDLTTNNCEPGRRVDEPLRVQLPKDFRLAQPAPACPAFRLVVSEVTARTDGHP